MWEVTMAYLQAETTTLIMINQADKSLKNRRKTNLSIDVDASIFKFEAIRMLNHLIMKLYDILMLIR